MFSKKLLVTLLLAAVPSVLSAWVADNGDGTYSNPILWGDYPDPDPIRVGDKYYMVSTSMHIMPGCPIMESPDLVNWKTVGYAVRDFDEHPDFRLDGSERYAGGPWAASLRYHEGKFYVCFNVNRMGFFMCIADDPAGPWKRYRFDKDMHDPGLLFDDGKVYVAHGRPNKGIKVTRLTDDATAIYPGQEDQLVYQNPKDWGTFEGSHFYKIGEWYYMCNTWGGKWGKQTVLRSKNVYGPYEAKQILDDGGNFIDYPYGLHQGGLVDTPEGDWWFIMFQDRDAVGRVPHLLPVTWVDDWPLLGVNGRTVHHWKKPNQIVKEPFVPATGDDFEKESLGLQWQWNHLPVAEKWSLKERPGWMRLHSVGVVENIHQARNTLTQRVVGPACSAEVTLDFSNLATGDVAGLSIFQDQHGYVGITKEEGFYLVMVKDHEVEERIPLDSSEPVRLKAVFDGIADIGTFAYEKNGEWVSIGCEVPLRFKLSHFVGNRFALFNFATNQEGGWADFDEFDFTPLPSGVYPVDLRNRTEAEHFIAQSGVQIESCDDEDGGYMIGDWDHHDWILLEPWIAGDDLRLELRVKNRFRRVKLRLRSGGVDGEILAVADVPATEEEWQTVTIEEPLNLSEGQKLCIQFRGLSPGFKLNYLKWKKEE